MSVAVHLPPGRGPREGSVVLDGLFPTSVRGGVQWEVVPRAARRPRTLPFAVQTRLSLTTALTCSRDSLTAFRQPERFPLVFLLLE